MRLTTGRIFGPISLLALSAALLPLMVGCAHKSVPAPVKTHSSAPSPEDMTNKLSNPSKKTEKPAPEPIVNEPKVGGKIQKPVIVWNEGNNQRMTASAREASFSGAAQIGELAEFSANLYENGKLSASITAPKAIADTQKRTVLATGGVIIKSLTRDTVVKADWIKWYAKKQQIIGDGGVSMVTKMNGGKVTTTGAAFVADTALKTIRIKSSSKGLQ